LRGGFPESGGTVEDVAGVVEVGLGVLASGVAPEPAGEADGEGVEEAATATVVMPTLKMKVVVAIKVGSTRSLTNKEVRERARLFLCSIFLRVTPYSFFSPS